MQHVEGVLSYVAACTGMSLCNLLQLFDFFDALKLDSDSHLLQDQ